MPRVVYNKVKTFQFFPVVRNNHRPVNNPNPKMESEVRKQRDAIKKELLQRKIDLRWDKDTHDRSRWVERVLRKKS